MLYKWILGSYEERIWSSSRNLCNERFSRRSDGNKRKASPYLQGNVIFTELSFLFWYLGWSFVNKNHVTCYISCDIRYQMRVSLLYSIRCCLCLWSIIYSFKNAKKCFCCSPFSPFYVITRVKILNISWNHSMFEIEMFPNLTSMNKIMFCFAI